MSSINVTTVRDAIRDACVQAWNVKKVHYGMPRTLQTDLPYAVIRLDSVPMTAESFAAVEQTYNYQIFLIASFDTNTVIEDAKVEKANALISILMSENRFAGVGRLPMITDVSFVESDDPDEPVYMLTVSFSVTFSAHWIGD